VRLPLGEERLWRDRLEADSTTARALDWSIGWGDGAALRLASAPGRSGRCGGTLGGGVLAGTDLALPDGGRPRRAPGARPPHVAWAAARWTSRTTPPTERACGGRRRRERRRPSLHYLGLVAWQRGDFRAMAAQA
jgi:hypothetical protein